MADFFANLGEVHSVGALIKGGGASSVARHFLRLRQQQPPEDCRSARGFDQQEGKGDSKDMQMATEQKQAPNHEEIAILAHDLWYQEGCQDSRDLEYWLRAERQLSTNSRRGNGQKGNALVTRKASSTTGKTSTTQPAPQAGTMASVTRKRK